MHKSCSFDYIGSSRLVLLLLGCRLGLRSVVTGAAVSENLTVGLGRLKGLAAMARKARMLGFIGVKSRKRRKPLLAASFLDVTLTTGNIAAMPFRDRMVTGQTGDTTV